MARIDYYINTWRYFNYFHKDIPKGTVLDYGSNYGMFLKSSQQAFPEENYTGIDVDLDAVNYGKESFPKANFIHYNKHNLMYNPSGIKNIWPDVTDYYDTVISYSVLTHTTVEDMIEAIDWLYSRLKPNGKLLLSWLDRSNQQALNFFYAKRRREFGRCDKIVTDDYVYLVNDKITKEPSSGMLLLFFDRSYLGSLLTQYNYQLAKPSPMIGDCFQDCIIINKQ